MANKRPIVTCIFCGLSRPSSTEDVLPKWARYAINPTSKVTIRAEPGGSTASTQHLVLALDDMVCEVCNTGWMHQLEEKVKPFVKPMLTNQRGADVDVTQQRDLARWAVMKALLVEHVMRKQNPPLRATVGYAASEPELAWLMAQDEPPPRSRVWLGAFDPEGIHTLLTQARLMQSVPAPGSGSDPLPSHMTTLTVGCVLFQVFTTNFVPADAQSLPQYDDDPPGPTVRPCRASGPSSSRSCTGRPVSTSPPGCSTSSSTGDNSLLPRDGSLMLPLAARRVTE